MSKSILTVCDKKKKKNNYDVILTFENDENNNLYVIYTANKFDEDGFLILYAGIYKKEDNIDYLYPIEEDEDWKLIEKVLRKIEKGKQELMNEK